MNCKKSLHCCQSPVQQFFQQTSLLLHSIDTFTDPAAEEAAVPNPTVTRRQNAVALFQEFMARAVAGGTPPKGLEQSFAAQAQISPSLWSQIKSARPIGDKLARQLEHHCGKPVGWLDETHDSAPQPDAAEERFIAAARKAWRAQNAKGKRELARLVKDYKPL
jgi:hypothetical protein